MREVQNETIYFQRLCLSADLFLCSFYCFRFDFFFLFQSRLKCRLSFDRFCFFLRVVVDGDTHGIVDLCSIQTIHIYHLYMKNW